MNTQKIILAGGTGSLGNFLAKYFSEKGFEIVVLSRSENPSKGKIHFRKWDGKTLGEWAKEVDGAICVINLSGKSVNCRYTEENKKEIIDSRVEPTAIIGKAIQNCANPPKVWINASSAAIYGNTETLTDENSKFGEGFSSEVCKKWETAFSMSETQRTRKVALRIGLVLSEEGGVLEPIESLAKFYLAGTIGSGNQFMSWIHEDDFGKLVELCITDESFSGVINACSPNPVTNKEFMKALRKGMGKSFGFPNPAFLVRIGAYFMRTEADLVLYGRSVVSKTLQVKKFSFQFPEINSAMKDIMHKKNAGH